LAAFAARFCAARYATLRFTAACLRCHNALLLLCTGRVFYQGHLAPYLLPFPSLFPDAYLSPAVRNYAVLHHAILPCLRTFAFFITFICSCQRSSADMSGFTDDAGDVILPGSWVLVAGFFTIYHANAGEPRCVPCAALSETALITGETAGSF